jgi:hypothetical protein
MRCRRPCAALACLSADIVSSVIEASGLGLERVVG